MAQDKGTGKGTLSDQAQGASSNYPGEEACYAGVWTVAMLTQFGSTVKEDCKVENTRRKISLPGHRESLALECRVPPKLAICRVSSVPRGLDDVGEKWGGAVCDGRSRCS